MSARNLKRLFEPRSIAFFGADRDPRSISYSLAGNLFHGGFNGPIIPVHESLQAIRGALACRSVEELPVVPDLAVIASAPDAVPGLIDRLGAKGTRAAIVLSPEFDRGGEGDGRRLRQAMLDAARPHCMRIMGPACLGVLAPRHGLNASYAHVGAEPGDLAFVAQSASITGLLLDWAAPRAIGFSLVASLGDMADVDFGDMLDYLALDYRTRAVLLYVESINDARKFMSAARTVSRIKPVIVFKAGAGSRGSMAMEDGGSIDAGAVYEAAFRRAGMLPVDTINELIAAARTLSRGTRANGDRLAIVCNGRGIGTMAADVVRRYGGRLSSLSQASRTKLDAVLPKAWAGRNPVNVFADADGERYRAVLDVLAAEAEADGVLVLHGPSAISDSAEVALATAEFAGSSRKPMLTVWLNEEGRQTARRVFAARKVANYDSSGQAVASFMQLVNYRRNQEMLMETPPSVPELFYRDEQAARTVVQGALDEGRTWLVEPEVERVLAAYGLPSVPNRVAATAEDAVRVADEIGYPVAVKIISPDVIRKGDVGGVALDIETDAAVHAAAERMRRRLHQYRPEARLDGFTVEPMVRRGHAHELRLGMVTDEHFGPAIAFGRGGAIVEVLREQVVTLPPLNINLALRLIGESTVGNLLQGYGRHRAANLEEVALALVKIAQLATDIGEIAEVNINPLLADHEGVLVLAARIRVAPAAGEAEHRLAIRPYPKELEKLVRSRQDDVLLLRPIRPEDEPALQAFVSRLTPEDIRLRFFSHLRELDHRMAAGLTQIDYERQMALLLVHDARPQPEIWGVVRINADSEGALAEYAIAVRSDLKGKGLGRLLMEEILAYAERRGIGEIWGEVLAENRPMLTLVRKLGFSVAPDFEEPGVMRVRLTMSDRTPKASAEDAAPADGRTSDAAPRPIAT
ncbi:MAG: bifunctional acetate--CoA ligase family protein/GNAT family N-acetyltransferase [Rhodospirillales bacterium]|nr:bifunctional acetate--CoA ligase family protein/GNAT family N-acetyltransferase [Rhodospirillales bacterium]